MFSCADLSLVLRLHAFSRVRFTPVFIPGRLCFRVQTLASFYACMPSVGSVLRPSYSGTTLFSCAAPGTASGFTVSRTPSGLRYSSSYTAFYAALPDSPSSSCKLHTPRFYSENVLKLYKVSINPPSAVITTVFS